MSIAGIVAPSASSGGAEACELTQSLETDAKAGNLDRAVNRLEKLEPILQSFARTIDDYLQTSI
ncbi:hypothetical protein [Planctomycetes bacterium TBK1r]|uniref:hypothetical protein n=1 Tax=Stieleria magnilauensis TaxID=2527963 RepID=UPI0011A59453